MGQAALDDQALQLDLRPGLDDLEDPVMERAGVDDGGAGAGCPLPFDDQRVGGAGDVQVTGDGSILLDATGILERQRVGAGTEIDGVRGCARVGVVSDDGGAQATTARATVGEGHRGDGRQDCAILEGLQVQEVDGGSSVSPLPAPTISGWPEFA